MRRATLWLLICATCLGGACATSTPKKAVSDLEIDVPWERHGAPQRQPAARGDAPRAATSEVPAAAQRDASPMLHTEFYYLTWQGKRIGEAREVFHRSESGVRLIRTETIRIKRSGELVESQTEITIDADLDLRAQRVELLARAGAVTRQGQAVRADDGSWVIALEGEKVRRASRDAVPLELVPYLAARHEGREYDSEVLLAGYGFAVTQLHLRHDGRQGRAVLDTQWGKIESDLTLAGNGSLERATTGSTGSVRVGEGRLKERFTPPELPMSTTIPVSGNGRVLLVQNTTRQPPPALAGQSVALRKGGWRIEFDRRAPRLDPHVVQLAQEVDKLLRDSHDAPGAGASDALSLGRGDCTAHATLFVDMAREQGYEAQLVTGYRIDGEQLVRHRWALVKQGRSWVQVDPTFGEAPVPPGHHLALAVHGDSTAQIALVDEAVFRGLDDAKARWVRGPIASR